MNPLVCSLILSPTPLPFKLRIQGLVKQVAILLTSTLCVLAFSVQTRAESISFDSAWQRVQKKNDTIAAAQENLFRYQSLHKASLDLDLPKVDLTGNYTRLDDDITVSGNQIIESTGAQGQAALGAIYGALGHILPPGLTSITSTLEEKDIFTSSIRAVWPAFTGWKITAAQEAAQGRTDEAQSLLEMKYQAKYEDLTKFYFSVVLTRQVVDTRRFVEKGLASHLDSALKLETQGQIAKVERLQAEASLSKARVDRKKAERDIEIAKLTLARLLKTETDFTLETPLFANSNLEPLKQYLEKTLASFPGLSLLDAKEKQAQSLIKAEQSAYYPNLLVYGNYSLYERESLTGQILPEWMLGAGIDIPIFDNGGRKDKVRAAHRALSQVKRLRTQAQSDLSVLVKKTYCQAQQALEEYYGLNKSIELANENLKLRKKAFSLGLSTSLDVVDAQLYLAGITTQQLVSQFTYVLNLNKLLALSNQMGQFSQYL
ncbi:MAG: TolC family protein [Desulfobacter sp.]|nr:TolC family protein [Desulfobacter sp.]